MPADALVIGAGVTGLSIARALARMKLSVEVLTRDEPGSGASGASAGMLEVHFPAPVPPAMGALCNPSRGMYDAFARELLEETGCDIELDRSGTFTLATTAEEFDGLRRQAREIPGSRLMERDTDWAAMEPSLSRDLAGALFLPDDHHVNPRNLCRALLISCERLGVRFRRGMTARNYSETRGRVAGVETDSGSVTAQWTVNAAGAWAGAIGGLPLKIPVRPVRGQILSLLPRPSPRFVLHGPSVYAVPRADGTMLLGATLDEAGYEALNTAGGTAGLLEQGFRLLPSLKEAALLETRAGLRPGTPDNLPLLGPTAWPGLLLAAGHFRKGILLAPVTAAIIAALISGTPSPVPLEPYAAGRFPPGPCASC